MSFLTRQMNDPEVAKARENADASNAPYLLGMILFVLLFAFVGGWYVRNQRSSYLCPSPQASVMLRDF